MPKIGQPTGAAWCLNVEYEKSCINTYWLSFELLVMVVPLKVQLAQGTALDVMFFFLLLTQCLAYTHMSQMFLSSTEVLITKGFIKIITLDSPGFTEKCSRFIAWVTKHINSITASLQSFVYGSRPSARQRQVSSWPAETHRNIFWPRGA